MITRLCVLLLASFVRSHTSRGAVEDNTPHCGTPDELSELDWMAVSYAAQSIRNSDTRSQINVPVCFHVVMGTETAHLAPTDQQLQASLDSLNRAFSTSSCCNASLWWCSTDDCSAPTNISFSLALVTEGGNETVVDSRKVLNVTDPGACVSRTINDDWINIDLDHDAMQGSLRLGGFNVLNVFFAITIQPNLLGFATFPWQKETAKDGVVVRPETVPGGTKERFDEGDTLVHEVGHWMGLLHTFHGGCGLSDGISDTPKQANQGRCNLRPDVEPADTCLDDPGTDPIHNFMDYSPDACRYEFTAGQIAMMHAAWNVFRRDGSGPGRDPPEIVQDIKLGEWTGSLVLAPEQTRIFRISNVTSCSVSCNVNANEGNVDLFLNIDRWPAFNSSDLCRTYSRIASKSCSTKPQKWMRDFFCKFKFFRKFVDRISKRVGLFKRFCSRRCGPHGDLYIGIIGGGDGRWEASGDSGVTDLSLRCKVDLDELEVEGSDEN